MLLPLDVSGLQKWVDTDLECLVQEIRNQFLKQDAGWCVQAGICVYFNQIYFHIRVDHEVVAKQLKLVFAVGNFILADFLEECGERVRDGILNLWEYLRLKLNIMLLAQELFKVLHRNLVARFIFSIFFISVLNCIIRQVDISVLQVVQIKFIWRCANVPSGEEVAPVVDATYDLCEAEHSYIELSEWRIVPVGSTD